MVQKLDPKAMGYSIAVLSAIDGLSHAIFKLLNKEFLWWNKDVWNLFFRGLPDNILGILVALIAYIVSGFIFGWLVAWLYNKCLK